MSTTNITVFFPGDGASVSMARALCAACGGDATLGTPHYNHEDYDNPSSGPVIAHIASGTLPTAFVDALADVASCMAAVTAHGLSYTTAQAQSLILGDGINPRGPFGSAETGWVQNGASIHAEVGEAIAPLVESYGWWN